MELKKIEYDLTVCKVKSEEDIDLTKKRVRKVSIVCLS